MPPKHLVQLLRSQVIPWTMSGTRNRIIVARPVMRAADLPDDATFSRRKLSGQRNIVKQPRIHGNQRLLTAIWPEDNLHEITAPKVSCVVHGAADYFMSKYTVYCSEGTFQIIPPGMPHQRFGPYLQGPRLRNGNCTQIHAYAHSQGILFWLTTSRNGEHVNDPSDNYLLSIPALMQLLKLTVEEALTRQRDAELICNNYLSAFFALIAREIESGNCVKPSSQENIHAQTHPAVSFAEQAQEYIEANCHKMLRVDDVAKHLYMSSSHFFRRMHEETGTTFTELLTRYRIEKACHLLRDTNLTVTAVASQVSFKSPTYFQSLFRASMGCTPTEYRNSSRQKMERNP